MKYNSEWSIIFCAICQEPTPPVSGMKTDHLGFVCDDCLNHEMENDNGSALTARHDNTETLLYGT